MNKNINNTELKEKDAPRNFWLSSFSIKNRTTVVLLMLLLLVAGAGAYQSMPKENFPEISIPTIYVGMTYAGNSPLDMEN
ncbi:MAG: efflux RND transporter permease subunit, partial [Chitinophagales bacterium]